MRANSALLSLLLLGLGPSAFAQSTEPGSTAARATEFAETTEPLEVVDGAEPAVTEPASTELPMALPTAAAYPRAIGPAQKDKARLTWSGRVFSGNTLTRRDAGGATFWRNELALQGARVGLRYDHPKGLRAVIKLEAARGDAEIRDGYIRVDLPASFQLQAGRFKKQISRIALDSRWDLPSVERGLLDSVTVEDQQLPFAGGRGEGVMVNYRQC